MNKNKTVSLVGKGVISLPYYWESASEVWGVKETIFALRGKGYKCSRTFYLDDINSCIPNWNDGTFEKITDDWLYQDADCFITNPIYRREKEFSHLKLFNYTAFVDKFNSDYINNSGVMAFCQAMLEGYEEIHLHGFDYLPAFDGKVGELVDRGVFKNLVRQASNLHYWIGRFEALGGVVKTNPVSPTMDEKWRTIKGYKIRGVYMADALNLKTTNKERTSHLLNQCQGGLREEALDKAIEETDNIKNIHVERTSSVVLVGDLEPATMVSAPLIISPELHQLIHGQPLHTDMS